MRVLTVGIGLVLLTVTTPKGIAGRQFLSDFVRLPPALKHFYGNPPVHVSREKNREETSVILIGSTNPILFVHPAVSASREETRQAISARLLDRFYNKRISLRNRDGFDRRLKFAELIPLDKDSFRKIGLSRLTGESTGSEVYDAWWDVRMGLPLTRSRTHQLVIINLHSENINMTAGHFTFGYRRRGGDPENDVMLDFRAPWEEDRDPTLMEGMNYFNTLKIDASSYNFYDWCYTQTEYRGCFIKFWFVPIAEEQLILLQDFAESGRVHDGGYFKGLKKNCASLGRLFYERILPFDESIGSKDYFADLPIATAERIRQRYDEPVFYRLANRTEQLGRTRTAASEIHRAQPDRSTSMPFRSLAAVPGIN